MSPPPPDEHEGRPDPAATPTAVVAPDPRPDRTGPLAARLADEMAAAWRRGERFAVEDLLQRHPDARDLPEVVLRLICEEVCLRQEAGKPAGASELAQRFPEWRAEIANLLDVRGQLALDLRASYRGAAAALADFELLADLGRGAQGRVFLARQRSLADRPVVLKVTTRQGREHLSLARLQHTHIVPLYWVQDDPDHDRRTLCMPYLGSLTLAALLPALRDLPLARRTGGHVLDALDRAGADSAVPLPARGPVRQALARATYAQAVAWVGACLAEALAYAHERGLVHLDLKPSNILLAADGQPMLLDFHLAQGPIPPGARPRWGLGGTPLYMSPEQRAATAAIAQGRPVPAAVDGRSDVYSLGLVLYQALGGGLPLQCPRPPRLDRCNVQVSPGLADVVHHCLEHDPRARYPDAGALAADLRRHLADLPLRGVSNRSWAERWRKWRRRRPYALLLGCLLALSVGCALGVGIWSAGERRAQVRGRLEQAEVDLREGQHLLDGGQYAAAAGRLERGLALAGETPGGEELAGRLGPALRQARRLKSARDLRRVADAVRFAAVAERAAAGDLRGLEKGCRALWDNRARILAPHQDAGADEVTRAVRADLLDLAVVGADLRLRLAAPGRAAKVRREALEILGQAEEAFGPNAVLLLERERLAGSLGQAEEARKAARRRATLPPRTAWEHYALGRRFLQAGELEQAAAELEQAVVLAPGDFWANFYQGKCAFSRGRYHEAVEAFRACLALSPQSAPSYHNRGLAHERLGDLERALRDYERALEFAPGLSEAAHNRARLQPKLRGK
jgi:eukaryotic-like serine/threonine-protein kinase